MVLIMESISSSRSVDQTSQVSAPKSDTATQPSPEALAAVAALLASGLGELGGALTATHQKGSADAATAVGGGVNPTQTAMINTMQMLHGQIKEMREQIKETEKQMWS
jgi:hypothetical protein